MVDIPLDIDPKYCAIGAMIIQWGFIEEFINDCVLLLYHKCDGKNTNTCKKFGMPRTPLNKKIEFLREILEHPTLSKYKTEGLSLICRAENLVKHRDTIIHSVVIELKSDSFKFSKHTYDNNAKKAHKPKLEHSEYTLDDLIKFGNTFQLLANDMAPFVQHLVNDLGNP